MIKTQIQGPARELTSTTQDGSSSKVHMPEGSASSSLQLPHLTPPMGLFSSPTQIKGTKAQTCKHRPHTDAHSRPSAHMLLLVFTIPHRHSGCTQTTNLQTCLHALAHVVIHPHVQAPPKTTRGRGSHPRALLLTKLTSLGLA